MMDHAWRGNGVLRVVKELACKMSTVPKVGRKEGEGKGREGKGREGKKRKKGGALVSLKKVEF